MRHFLDVDAEGNIIIHPDLLTIDVFRRIWERDKDKTKKKAHLDISYIYWSIDFRSYVSDITDPDEKHEAIVPLIDATEKYQPDELVKEAIEVYKKDLPLSLLVMEDAKSAINELRRHYRELNLKDVDKNGKLIHDASKVQNGIKTLSLMLDDIEKIENKVKKDMSMSGDARGDKKKSMYED